MFEISQVCALRKSEDLVLAEKLTDANGFNGLPYRLLT